MASGLLLHGYRKLSLLHCGKKYCSSSHARIFHMVQYRFNATSHEYEGYEFRVPYYSLDTNCKSLAETCASVHTVPVLSSAHAKKFLLASVCSYTNRYMKTDKLDSCNNHRTIEQCAFNGILFSSRTKNLLKIRSLAYLAFLSQP